MDASRFPASKKPESTERAEPLKKNPQPSSVKTTSEDVSSPPHATVDPALSTRVYTALQKLRLDLVNEAGGNLMPYHIMGNAELHQISKRLPRTIDELLEVNGIGKVKSNKYGARILDAVASAIEAHQSTCNANGATIAKRRRGSEGKATQEIHTASSNIEEDFAQDGKKVKTLKPKKKNDTGAALTSANQASTKPFSNSDLQNELEEDNRKLKDGLLSDRNPNVQNGLMSNKVSRTLPPLNPNKRFPGNVTGKPNDSTSFADFAFKKIHR